MFIPTSNFNIEGLNLFRYKKGGSVFKEPGIK